ncbi:hypothetical protein [Brevibacillus formosus]|uniref:hypothetical protein n=2 Tax=Brevibacillus TaxID=55080 RepID=UPI001F54BB3C|nr:hypothetical protein [Brevibacillus formosus]MED1996177.1 hypothetical protein [Brevibacillus formosus]
MKGLLIFCVNGIIAIWFGILWLYKMLLSSDMPMSISSDEMQYMILTLFISTIVALIYVKFTSNTRLVYFLVIPSFLWGFSMVQSLIKSYHEYNTIITIAGFVGSMLIVITSSLNARRLSKSP